VVTVVRPPGLSIPRAPMVLAGELRRDTWVWNIGSGANWDLPSRPGGLGPADPVTGLLRVDSLHRPPARQAEPA
jgi:hypothetical protein